MGRKSVGPRLYFRRERIHSTRGTKEPGVWIIRDGAKFISTGFGEGQEPQAQTALAEYVARGLPHAQFFIYFLSAKAPGFPIKIGISTQHQARFISLQTALPYELDVMAIMPTTDPIMERRLHRQFRHLHLRGEWFERSPELEEYIEKLSANGLAA
jgi:hypothetical protein